MPLDELPDGIVTPTRDKIRDDYGRDYKLRIPAADVGPKTQPYIDGSVFADAMMPAYNNAVSLGKATNLRGKSTRALDEVGATLNRPRGEETGASGFVKIVAAAGGTTLFVGDELTYPPNGVRYEVAAAGLYLDAAQVPVIARDKGPSTNLLATRVLEFSAPRPGCGQKATVVAQSDGSGLTGGRNRETNEEYIVALEERLANPPASGNDTETILVAESTPGVAVQKGFVYPAIKGTGTKGVAITLRPLAAGGSRVPNAVQLTTLLTNMVGRFPSDDAIFAISLFSQLVSIGLKVTWQQGVPGFVDATPWPPYDATPTVTTIVTQSTNTVRVSFPGTIAAPVAGQTIAFFNKATLKFIRKRILTATLVTSTTYDLVFSSVLGASDDSFFPAVGAWVSPWSDSLNAIPPLVAAEIDKLGPGEQVSPFPDPGRRQRRQPESPAQWPSVLTNRVMRPVLDLALISDADLVKPTLPFATTVGTPGVSSNLLELGDFGIWPQ